MATGLAKVNPYPNSPRKVVSKNALTVRQLHSSPMLASSCLNSCMLRYSIMQTKNFQMSTLGLQKEEEPEIKLPTFTASQRKLGYFQKNIYLYFIDYTTAFDCVDCNKLWKALKEMGIPDYLTCLVRNLYVSQEATVRTLYGKTDWFKIKKGV